MGIGKLLPRSRVPRWIGLAVATATWAGGCYDGVAVMEDADGGAGDDGDPPPAVASVDGLIFRVLDTAARPIAGASVTIGCPCPGAAASPNCRPHYSDDDGRTAEFAHRGGRTIACVEADGFATATAVLTLRPGADLEHEVRLLPLGEPLRPETTPDGYRVARGAVQVLLPTDSVVDPATGSVGEDFTVTIADLDPADPTVGLRAAPGPLLASEGGQRVLLESVRMADITLWRDGRRLQLAEGARATLELLVAPDHPGYSRLTPGTMVPAWSYDLERGEWRREADGVIVERPAGRTWVAEVTHFSWWNADVPSSEKDCFDVEVKHEQEQGPDVVLADIPVTAEGVDYAGFYTAFTDAQGHACVEIPEGGAAKIYAGTYKSLFKDSTIVDVVGDGILQGDKGDSMGCGDPDCAVLQPIIVKGALCGPPGAIKEEYAGPAATKGVGLCQAATFKCDNDVWMREQDEILPTDEIPNNQLDEDCNDVEDDVPGANCLDNQTGPCTAYSPLGLCTSGVNICTGLGIWECRDIDAPGIDAVGPADEDEAVDLDEDCDGWPTEQAVTNYLLFGGIETQTVLDVVPFAGGVALVGVHNGDTLSTEAGTTNAPGIAVKHPGGPLFVATYEPGVQPTVGTFSFTYPEKVDLGRAIAVATLGGDLVIAGQCFGAMTLPDGAPVNCGPHALFVAWLTNQLATADVAVFPQDALTTLEDLSVAATANRVYVGGSFRHSFTGDIVLEAPQSTDGFLLTLDAGLAPVQVVAATTAIGGDPQGVQTVTHLRPAPQGVYVGGDFQESVRLGNYEALGSGVFLARVDGGVVQEFAAIQGSNDNAGPCKLADLEAGGAALVYLAIRGCNNIETSDQGPVVIDDPASGLDRGFGVRVHVDAMWRWQDEDILSLFASDGDGVTPLSIAPYGADGVLVAGEYQGTIAAVEYPDSPLSAPETPAGFFAHYQFAAPVDPWLMQVPARPDTGTLTGVRVAFEVADGIFLSGSFAGGAPPKLHLDQPDPLSIAGSAGTDAFLLHIPKPFKP